MLNHMELYSIYKFCMGDTSHPEYFLRQRNLVGVFRQLRMSTLTLVQYRSPSLLNQERQIVKGEMTKS